MDDTERLAAVIHENNKLRKENERLRSVEADNDRLRGDACKAAADAGNAWKHAMHWKGRDDARGKAMPTLLANEWNAAIEAATKRVENVRDETGYYSRAYAEVIRALKREAK